MFGILEIVEPFTILLALLPLIGYLIVLSAIRLSGRALVTTGGRDIAALAVAISGMLAVGPAELFFPTAAATVFGPAVWVPLAIFYLLCTTLIALTTTPKLVVYGRTPEELFESVIEAAREMDSKAEGDPNTLQVHMPQIGVRLRVDGMRYLDHAQIVAFEPSLSPRFWKVLLVNVRKHVGRPDLPVARRGFAMLVVVLVMGTVLLWQSLGNRDLVVEGFQNWLWR